MEIAKINKSIKQKETLGRELSLEFWKEIYENTRNSKYNNSIEKLLNLKNSTPKEDILSKIIEGIKNNKTINLTKEEESKLTPEYEDLIKDKTLIKSNEQGISITPIPDIKTLEDKIHNGEKLSDKQRKNLNDCIEHPKIKELLNFDKEVEKQSNWIIYDSKTSIPRPGFEPSKAARNRAHEKTGYFYGVNADPGVEHLKGK